MAKEQAPKNPPQLTLIPDPAPSGDKPDFSQGLNGKQLGDRLGRAKSRVSEAWKPENPNHFRQWSQKLDPDGLGWEKRGDRFFPLG